MSYDLVEIVACIDSIKDEIDEQFYDVHRVGVDKIQEVTLIAGTESEVGVDKIQEVTLIAGTESVNCVECPMINYTRYKHFTFT